MSQQYVTTNTTSGVVQAHPIVDAAPDPPDAVPLDQVQTHQDPFEATKEIRSLIKEVRAGLHDSYVHSYSSEVNAYLGRIQLKLDTIDLHLPRLEKAIVERKTAAGRAELGLLKTALNGIRQDTHYARDYSNHAITAAKKIKTLRAGPVDRIYKLVQAIPTVPGMPSTPAENILLSIASLLKVGGFHKDGDAA